MKGVRSTPPLGAENSCKREQRTNLFGLCQVSAAEFGETQKIIEDDFSGDKIMRSLRSRLVDSRDMPSQVLMVVIIPYIK